MASRKVIPKLPLIFINSVVCGRSYQNLQPMCAVDASQIKKMIEEERIYEFLGGLNSEYDPVRVQIFGKEPLPSL